MKKILVYSFSTLIVFLILSVMYLSTIGYETKKLNFFFNKKIKEYDSALEVRLQSIKIKFNLKNFNFFITTLEPDINFNKNDIDIKKIDAYISLKSILKSEPNIKNIYISSKKIQISQLKKLVKYLKPSTIKRMAMNNLKDGDISINLDLDLNADQTIKNYELDGSVANLTASIANIDINNGNFIYSFNKNSGELSNLSIDIDSFQVNSGKIEFNSTKDLLIQGNIQSDFNLDKKIFIKFFKDVNFNTYKNFSIRGDFKKSFIIKLDETLKVKDYNFKIDGELKKTLINLSKPIKVDFFSENLNSINFDKTFFKIDYSANNKNLLKTNGLYSLNNLEFQKFDSSLIFNKDSNKLKINADFIQEIRIPFINFYSLGKKVNIIADILFNKNTLNIKTFNKELLQNDLEIILDKKIKISGSKYDAANLTKILDENKKSNLLSDLNNEINISIDEISTSALSTSVLSKFNLIGKLDKGKPSKITSKGEFKDNQYLEIALAKIKNSNKKTLEIYSDLPELLLSNYSFFKGLSGGNLLFNSTYDNQISDSKLVIEDFKLKNAPGFVKLLSLADLSGMADALAGDGLSFERLEIVFEKNEEVLKLKELYAIGPSVSILMDGYVETRSGLVSLRGTMVPAKTLNKFLSKIPVVGNILIPKEIGEGLFGVSFKMKGIPNKIKTTVNPIKTLTPRFIQKALKKKPK